MLSLVENISDNQFSTDVREHSCESISLQNNCVKTENIDHTLRWELLFVTQEKKIEIIISNQEHEFSAHMKAKCKGTPLKNKSESLE